MIKDDETLYTVDMFCKNASSSEFVSTTVRLRNEHGVGERKVKQRQITTRLVVVIEEARLNDHHLIAVIQNIISVTQDMTDITILLVPPSNHDVNHDDKHNINGEVTGDVNGDIKHDVKHSVSHNVNSDVNRDDNGNVDRDVNGGVNGDVGRDVNGSVNHDVNGDVKHDVNDDVKHGVNNDVNRRQGEI